MLVLFLLCQAPALAGPPEQIVPMATEGPTILHRFDCTYQRETPRIAGEGCLIASADPAGLDANLHPVAGTPSPALDFAWLDEMPAIRTGGPFGTNPEVWDYGRDRFRKLYRSTLPDPTTWSEPLRHARLYYDLRHVPALQRRKWKTSKRPLPTAWLRPAAAIFTPHPVAPIPDLLALPERLTLDQRLDPEIKLEILPESEGGTVDLVLDYLGTRRPDGSVRERIEVLRWDAAPVTSIDGLTGTVERRAAPSRSLAPLPIGPYRLRAIGNTGATLDEATFRLVAPPLEGALRVVPDGQSFDWQAPPEVQLVLPKLPKGLRARISARLVRERDGLPETVAEFACGSSGLVDPCTETITLATPEGALAPGTYHAELLLLAGQPDIAARAYRLAERRFEVTGSPAAERFASSLMPEDWFAAETVFDVTRNGPFGPFQSVSLTLRSAPSDALDDAGAFLMLAPRTRFTWGCQALAEAAIEGPVHLTRLGAAHVQLGLARGALLSEALSISPLLSPNGAQPSEFIPQLKAPPPAALGVDAFTEESAQDTLTPAAPLSIDHYSYGTPRVLVQSAERVEPGTWRISLMTPAEPGGYELMLFVGGKPATGRLLASWPFEVAAAQAALSTDKPSYRLGFDKSIRVAAAAPALAPTPVASYRLELWSQGDRSAAGAPVYPLLIAAKPMTEVRASTFFALAEDWRRQKIASGPYEIRLTLADAVIAARPLRFDTISAPLSWPAELAPRATPDPLGDSEPGWSALPPSSLCGDPEFRTPPQLTLAAVVPMPSPPEFENPQDPGRARTLPQRSYAGATRLHFGHPVFVEARFAEGDALEPVYFVKVEGAGAIRVERTEEDRLLYRSGPIAFTHRGALKDGPQ